MMITRRLAESLAISAQVDGILVVTRLDHIHRRTLGELHRVLATAPAKTLGFVATGSDAHEDYAYGYGYGHSSPAPGPQPLVS